MRSSLKSHLKVSLICLILIFSLSEVSQAHEHEKSYSHNGRRQGNNPRWMTALRDDLRLSELSIPGTHESMARFGTDYAECQSMTLADQLQSGIRVLDIRCAVAKPIFQIYHGIAYQHASFDDVLRTVVAFLRNHRGETVLMRVKEERTNRPGEFEEIFRHTYWNNTAYKDFMWKGKDGHYDPNPTLGEIRGKIVILQDFARWTCPNPGEVASRARPGIRHMLQLI